MKNSNERFSNCLQTFFLGAVIVLAFAFLLMPLAVKAEPTKANGHIFLELEELDIRVSAIENGIAPSKFFAIGMRDFQPNSDVFYGNDTSIGAYAKSFTPLYAPVHLPDDVVVTRVVCFFYDIDEENDLGCYLGKNELSSGDSDFIGHVFSDGYSGDMQRVFILNETINNFDNSYFIQIRPHPRDPIDPLDNDEWGFEDDQQHPDFGPLTLIKGVRISYHVANGTGSED